MKVTATLTADPNPILVDWVAGVGRTTLSWRAEGPGIIEVRVGAADGPLFSRGGAVGRAETGEWVQPGMVFYLLDATNGDTSPHRTLTTLTMKGAVASTVPPEIARLRLLPRHQPAETLLLGPRFEMVDADSFLHMYHRIFVQDLCAFRGRDERPRVIDGGANIGLFVEYCKQRYPSCEVVAIEADGDLCDVLERNVARAGHRDVQVVRAALAPHDGELHFRGDALGGRVTSTSSPGVKTVRAVRLGPYIGGRVDLLKLSIEGAETAVLLDAAESLTRVDNIAIRYHSRAGEPQTLHQLLSVLANAGFRLHIKQFDSSPQPLLARELHNGEDLQLRVFGFRE